MRRGTRGALVCGALACGAAALIATHHAPRPKPREEDEDRGPLGTRRAGAAELAVINRAALAEAKKLRRGLHAHAATVAGTWVSLGPTAGEEDDEAGAIVAGRINDIVVDPRDPDVVYLATSGGGVWKSFDAWSPASARWSPLSDDQPSLAAGALAIDPDHPDRLYVGYGDFFHTAGNTVSKTVDGGVTWSDPVALAGSYPSGLPSQVGALRSIGVHGDRVIAGTDAGLYVSRDAGASFALVDLPNRSGNVLPEAIWTVLHVGDDHWVASGVTGCDEQSAPLPPRTPGQDAGPACRDGNNGELWTSRDGETWTLASVPIARGAGRIELAAGHSGSPDTTVVYASVGAIDHSRTLAYWRSNNGGQSWRDATGSLAAPTNHTPAQDADCPSVDLAQFQTWYDQAIAVDPYNPDHVLIGGRLCGARTLDGTSAHPTWELVAHWAPSYGGAGSTGRGTLSFVHADWQSATIVRVGGELRALAGTDGGLFTSANLFAAGTGEAVVWTNRNAGLTTHLMFSLASGDPATGNPFVLFGGLQDNGTRLRTDPAKPSVFDEVIGGDGIGATVHVATSGTTYWASLQGARLYCQPGVNDCARAASWTGVAAVPGDPSDEPARGDSEPFSIRYANVALDTAGQSVLTTSVGQVFVAVASVGGLAWQAISQDVSPDIYLTNVAASPTIPGLYGASAASGFRGSGPSPVPFYVTAQGNTPSTWIAAKPVQPTGGAAMATASAIAFPTVLPPGTTPGQVYLGAFRGVLDDPAATPPPDDQGRLYRTHDFGQTWTSSVGADPAHRLPNVPIYVVTYDPVAPATIYAGTELGVYVSLDDGATWDRLGDGLPIVPVRDLYVARNQEFLRAATFGRGLWEIYPSATASHGAAGNGDYDRNQQIDWIDVAALAARLGTSPGTTVQPGYTWLLDVSALGHDPPVQALDEGDLAALLGNLGGAP